MAEPAWFGQPQLFKNLDKYETTDPLIGKVPFTGLGWGLLPNYPALSQFNAQGYSPIPGNIEQEASQVSAWRFGGPYFASGNAKRLYDSPPPSWDSFRMRNLEGNYINDYYGNTFAPLYSLSSPVFKAFLKTRAKEAVDMGADGFLVDDPAGQVAVMLNQAPQNAGSFDAVTMTAFQVYLQQKYGSAALQSQFGIADISSFNFAGYIQSNGLGDTWNRTPLAGISLEYFLFKRQETVSFLADLVSSTKQYARQVYNRDFLFTCNCGNGQAPGGGPSYGGGSYFARDAMDLTTNESYYLQGSATPFIAPFIRAGKGWRKQQLILAESGVPVAPGLITAPTANLMRVIIADIMAAGGVLVMEDRINDYFAPQPVDLSVVIRYANFALANAQLLSQTSTHARVALVESAPSVIGGVIANSGQNNPMNGPRNYIGTARLLFDSGMTYDSSFFPDSTYSNLPSPQASDLAGYSVVIAPSSFALDDNQTATLLAYAHQGGTLIVDGDFATNEPNGATASHPELISILAAPGATSYGAGRIVFSKELFGLEYQATSGGTLPGIDNVAQRQARASFQAFVSPYIQPDVLITQPPAQIYEPGVTPFLYHDRAGNTLVHLVNYDYDLARRSILHEDEHPSAGAGWLTSR